MGRRGVQAYLTRAWLLLPLLLLFGTKLTQLVVGCLP